MEGIKKRISKIDPDDIIDNGSILDKSIIDWISYYLDNSSNDSIFMVTEDGTRYGMNEAIEKKIVGRIEKDYSDRKAGLYNFLFGKEKINEKDFLLLERKFSEVIEYVWNEFHYQSKAAYLEDNEIIRLLLKYGIEIKLPKVHAKTTLYNQRKDQSQGINEFFTELLKDYNPDDRKSKGIYYKKGLLQSED